MGCSERKDNFTLVQTMILVMKKSQTMPNEIGDGDPVQVTGLRWERERLNSSRSKQDHENVVIESQRENYKEHRKTHAVVKFPCRTDGNE